MSIRERWVSLLHRAATGTRKTRTLLTPIGVLIFGLFTTLFVYVALLVDRAFALPWPFAQTVSWMVATSMISVGITVTAWSAFHFLKVKGTPVPFNPPPTLVESGPYRFARNPMLAGVFLLLLGVGFAIQSLSLLLVFTPLFVLVNVWELKEIEEPELIRRLGEDYVAYRERTPMFIPRTKLRK
jgi:protein-S-isoprenylcysteine O-methyltransferase Ste14